MAIPDKYTNADDTPTREGWKQIVVYLWDNEGMTPKQISVEIGMELELVNQFLNEEDERFGIEGA
jgi:hypothetical protein